MAPTADASTFSLADKVAFRAQVGYITNRSAVSHQQYVKRKADEAVEAARLAAYLEGLKVEDKRVSRRKLRLRLRKPVPVTI